MRLIIALLLSFQFTLGQALANVGEKVDFSLKGHLLSTIAASEARGFEQDMRTVLKRVGEESPKDLMKELGAALPQEEKAALLMLLRKTGMPNPGFTEKKPGHWEFKSGEHKITFSLVDLHQGQMWINGKVFKFKGVPFASLETALSGFELPLKTTFLQMIFEKTFGVESAHALGPFLIIVGVVAVAILGYAVWELKMKPEKMVKRINEVKAKLENDARMCQEAPSDRSKYEKTFELASSVSDRASYNTASASGALELALKEQLSSGERNDSDCFKIMNEAGKKVDLDIPVPSDRQIQMRELGMGAKANSSTDVTSSIFGLCQAYNALGSCMETFVADHVNDSGIDSFKDSARENFYQYQKRSKASRQ